MREKNPNAVAGGREAKAAGASFEAWGQVQHEAAKVMGVLARVQHNEPQAKFVCGRLTYVGKSGTDYDGFMVGGKPFASEMKSQRGRLSRKIVKPKQAAQLDDVVREGGVAHLLAEFRPLGAPKRRFAIPWTEVPWVTLRSAQSIGLEDMRPEWEVREGECYLKRGVPMVAGGRRRVFARE